MRPLALSRELLRRLQRLARETRANGALAAAVAALIVAAAVDYLLHFGFLARFMLLALTIAAAGGVWRLLGRRHPASTATGAALVVERLRRSRDSLFVTGVEIEDRRAHGDPTLAEHVVNLAATEVTEAVFAELDRHALRQARRTLAGVLLIAAALLVATPEIAGRHLGRILLPFARIAPATATRLAVQPGDIAVREGDNLAVHLTVTGELSFLAEVEVRDETGTISRLAMQPAGGDTASRRFTALLENIRGPLSYRVSAGDAISFYYDVTCLQPPRLAGLRVRLKPPAYLDQAETILVDPSTLAVPRGGTLEYELEATRPLAAAIFHYDVGDTVETGAAVIDDATALWPQTPTESGTLECELTGTNGVGGPARLNLALTIIEDAPPDLVILSPHPRARAVVSEEIPFLAMLRDDHRLRDCRIWIAVSAETEVLWRTLPLSGDTARLAFDLPLEEFVLEPGDVVHVRIEARDLNPEGRSTNRSRSIQIVPYERYYRYLERMPPMFAALAPRLRAFIERQRALIERTTAALGSDRELLVVSANQERLRADLRGELEHYYELMRQEDPLNRDAHVLDGILMKAEAAAREMAQAVSRLEAGEGEPGLGHERAALAALMKSLAALLVIVTPDAPPQSGEVEPTDEQFEDLPRPEEPREATASPETSGDRTEAEAAQSLLEQAEAMRREGKATPEELDRLAAEAERLAAAEDQGGQQSPESGQRAEGDARGEGEQSGSGENQRPDGQGRQSGDGGRAQQDATGAGDGQRTGERGSETGQDQTGSTGRQGREAGDRATGRTGAGDGQRTGERGSETGQDQTGSTGRQGREAGDQATGRTGAGDGQRTGDPGRATDGMRPSDEQSRRTGGSGRLTNETARQWRAMSATGERRDRARRLNEIAARLRQLARQGRVGNLNSGQLVDELDSLITLLTEIRDVVEARQLARSMLEDLALDPESVPAEWRELVRRYFERLNR